MTSRSRESLFRLCAAGAVVAGTFHLAAMVNPAIARIEYDSTYPAWRHVLFIAINGAVAWLLIRRPRWFVWPFALLTIHVVAGHGYWAWHVWTFERRVDWISFAVVIATPAILALLFIDRQDRNS